MALKNAALTLTDYEQLGFSLNVNLADGHAYHELSAEQNKIIDQLSFVWRKSNHISIPESEHQYISQFSSLIDSTGLPEAPGKFILPTASNSIDLIATYLKSKNSRVLLLYPTFDNLALLLYRHEVNVDKIGEDELRDDYYLSKALIKKDVLFIVNPNNPTGKNLTENEFIEIAIKCKKTKTLLVIDASFRLFYQQTWDSYKILNEVGVSYIIFEDTGKVFPTQDMKASILACSSEHINSIKEIYNELYLCVSKFSLYVLSEFFSEACLNGLTNTIHSQVHERRDLFRKAIDSKFISSDSINSKISVEWLNISSLQKHDMQVVKDLSDLGLGVLPGNGFFWHKDADYKSKHNIRISLMKPIGELIKGTKILQEYLNKGSGN